MSGWCWSKAGSLFCISSDLAGSTRVSTGVLDASEPFNALFLVFPPSLSSRLFGWELLSCLQSASNFLLLFCSSSFPWDLMKRSFPTLLMIQVLPVSDPLYLCASFSHNAFDFLSCFFPPFLSSLFPDPAAASSWSLCNSGRTFQLGTASLEDGVRRTSGRKTKKKCHVILHC